METMRKQTEKNKDMSLDQQITFYEDRINQLEQMKRTLIVQNNSATVNDYSNLPDENLNRINVDINESYEHIAILKIRKMMGF
jgi:hypothetical protein